MQLQKILHVEDDESIRLIVEMALVDLAGFTLLACDNGMSAVVQVSQFQPDLILLDVMMPGMDGLQTLQAIRQQPDCQHIPVVFMTARIQSEEKQQYLAAGAIAVIEKPFHAPSLGPELLAIFQQHNTHQP